MDVIRSYKYTFRVRVKVWVSRERNHRSSAEKKGVDGVLAEKKRVD